MEAVIYTRVSDDDSGRSRSTADQEKDCREHCAKQGWTVKAVLCDEGVGASRYSRGEREAFKQLETILQRGNVLVFWEASRSQRDLAAYVKLRDLSARIGAYWCYSGKLFDLTRGDDRFVTGLDALLSEREVDQFRERVERGRRSAAALGKPGAGPAPWGYKPLRDDRTGDLINWVPDPEEARLVRDAARSVLAGESTRSVLKRINAGGVLHRRRPQSLTALRRALMNPQLVGLRKYQGEIVGEGTWEPILTREDHEKLVATLTAPSRKTHHGTEPKWLLTGIAVCGVCGASMATKGNKSSRIYICRANRGCVGRNVEYADEVVKEAALYVLERLDPAIFGEDDGSASEVLAELAESESLLEEYRALADAREISPQSFARFEQKLLTQIESARSRLSVSQRMSAALAIAGPDARRFWASMEANGTQGLLDRRAIVRCFRVTIKPVGRGRKLIPESIGVELLS
ncbi:recombinase family protein [Mycobacteroides abscessus]|uniref:recombinase family protein n=1 Tax=Mycobacteroides abscessus TaxID=36809 RepID=UPI000C26BA74|nr:recombinase family protein [Mycobacteroides abscessus]PVB24479.1 recombinase family protein [Mycobacteroides abscessus]